MFKKTTSGFLKKPTDKSENSQHKRFDRTVKDPQGTESVAASQISQPQPSAGPLGNTSGLVLTTCLKLAMVGENRLTTGCDILTDFLRGGLLPGKLYEIYGESGSGKTQLAI